MKRTACLILSIIFILLSAFSVAAAEPDAEIAPASSEPTEPPVQPEVIVEVSAPVVTFTDVPVSTYVEVTLLPADGESLPEGAELWYRTEMSDWLKYEKTLVIDENCAVFAKIVLADGTESAITSAEITCIDKMPPTPPEIVPSTVVWVKDRVDVSIVSGSDAESGILRSEYRLGENGQWTEYTEPVAVTSEVVFYARSVDVAGNFSTLASRTINNFDVTAPDVSSAAVSFTSANPPVQIDSGVFGKYYRSDVTVTIDGARDTQSGLAGYQYQFAGSSESISDDGWINYNIDAKPVIKGDFCGYVYIRAYDIVGNYSASVVSEGIVLDATAPVISNISMKPTEITDSRVTVTFNVTDNIWLDTVMVNSSYVGTYAPTFTVFRNGDYTITAVDKAGNVATAKFSVTNIDSTPFSLLSVFKQLDEDSFTPSSWKGAAAAADELQRLLTVESGSAQISAASEKLTTAMENLVARGDGTMSLQLIERVNEYEKEKYTESSWVPVDSAIAAINACLDNPESTQADVDAARRSLEVAINELVLLGNFTGLDRLIEQCEAIPSAEYDPVKYSIFTNALNAAKSLSRTDSSQADVDAAYSVLLSSMDALKIEEVEPKPEMPLVGYVIIGLLVVFILIIVFILIKGRQQNKEQLVEDGSDAYASYDFDSGSEDTVEEDDDRFNVHPDIGDISFSDSDD